MKSRIILKGITISLMLVSIFTIIAALIVYKAGVYPYEVINYHMYAGMLFVAILSVHIYMMRQKLKKLVEQIISLALTGEVTSLCASQLLPDALHSKSLGEFCRFLSLDTMSVREKLQNEQIMVIDMEEAIEKIAAKNRVDVMKIGL